MFFSLVWKFVFYTFTTDWLSMKLKATEFQSSKCIRRPIYHEFNTISVKNNQSTNILFHRIF